MKTFLVVGTSCEGESPRGDYRLVEANDLDTALSVGCRGELVNIVGALEVASVVETKRRNTYLGVFTIFSYKDENKRNRAGDYRTVKASSLEEAYSYFESSGFCTPCARIERVMPVEILDHWGILECEDGKWLTWNVEEE